VDGVLVLLKPAFRQRLQQFNARLEQYRAARGKRLLDNTIYERLPYARAVRDDFEWRLRRYDLAVIRRLLRGRRRQSILDVGAWNGWLSHCLAAEGHEVTAIDYFTDRFDGLGACAFYSTSWQALQMDLTDLSSLDQTFDMVVLNRCLQFFSDPARYMTQASGKVAPGGVLIATGLAFYKDPTVKAREVRALQESYHQQYGAELFLHSTKGYLDFGDRSRLAAQGVRLRPYRQLIPANVKSLLRPTRPRYYYGLYAPHDSA
jgi:2-polyprenyl-3-methyl-5-hydroxy-6-metoxy-1,4-benzoquinol methylase